LTMCYNQQQTYVVSNSFGTRTYLWSIIKLVYFISFSCLRELKNIFT
jgi:hypothetical protein